MEPIIETPAIKKSPKTGLCRKCNKRCPITSLHLGRAEVDSAAGAAGASGNPRTCCENKICNKCMKNNCKLCGVIDCVCKTHIFSKCKKCTGNICNNCSKKCEGCNDIICNACESFSCAGSFDDPLGEKQGFSRAGCNKIQCGSCVKECDKCNKKICASCYETMCEACSYRSCCNPDNKFNRCERLVGTWGDNEKTCNKLYCSSCDKQDNCSVCEKSVCKDCIVIDERTGSFNDPLGGNLCFPRTGEKYCNRNHCKERLGCSLDCKLDLQCPYCKKFICEECCIKQCSTCQVKTCKWCVLEDCAGKEKKCRDSLIVCKVCRHDVYLAEEIRWAKCYHCRSYSCCFKKCCSDCDVRLCLRCAYIKPEEDVKCGCYGSCYECGDDAGRDDGLFWSEVDSYVCYECWDEETMGEGGYCYRTKSGDFIKTASKKIRGYIPGDSDSDEDSDEEDNMERIRWKKFQNRNIE
jgi:hypothetical protein